MHFVTPFQDNKLTLPLSQTPFGSQRIFFVLAESVVARLTVVLLFSLLAQLRNEIQNAVPPYNTFLNLLLPMLNVCFCYCFGADEI